MWLGDTTGPGHCHQQYSSALEQTNQAIVEGDTLDYQVPGINY
jgi:hypothetical protein